MSLTVQKCLEAWTYFIKQSKVKADIVFFGDSLTFNGDFASVFPQKKVFNLGLRGDTLEGLKDRINQVELLKPDLIFLMAGINDVSSSNPKEFAEKYESLIQLILGFIDRKRLYVQSMLPVDDVRFPISCSNEQIRICNKETERLARKYKIHFVDLFSVYQRNGILPIAMSIDGIHLYKDAYNQWYSLLRGLEIPLYESFYI